jgi:hypothetical protein
MKDANNMPSEEDISKAKSRILGNMLGIAIDDYVVDCSRAGYTRDELSDYIERKLEESHTILRRTGEYNRHIKELEDRRKELYG